jgi:hypothetical protein
MVGLVGEAGRWCSDLDRTLSLPYAIEVTDDSHAYVDGKKIDATAPGGGAGKGKGDKGGGGGGGHPWE